MCFLLYVRYTNMRIGEHNHPWRSILCNEYSLLAPWRTVLQTNNCSLHKKLLAFHANVEDCYHVREEVIKKAKIVKIVPGLRRCVLNICNSLPNYTASHAKDRTARFSPCQQQLAFRPYTELDQSYL